MQSFFKSLKFGWLGLLVILAVAAFAYSPSLDVPFYLDDSTSVETNVPDYKEQPLTDIWTDAKRRSLSYTTIWLDTRIHDASVSGFHITNIIIHLLVSVALFVFSRALVKALKPTRNATWWALAITALWALHPLNSQAVIYVVQRMASLAALFGVLSMWGWLNWRTTETKHRFNWLIISLLAFVLAWNSKESAAVIPLLWLSIDAVLPRQKMSVWKYLAIGSAGLLAIALPVINGLKPELVQQLDSLSRETSYFSRMEYFWAQQEILLSYIGKWVWPEPLLMYYPFYEGGSFDQHAGYLLLHVIVIGSAIVLRKRLPLAALGVFVFYAGHALESGFLPIKDIAFEHRNYLPSVGLALLSVALFNLAFRKSSRLNSAKLKATSVIVLAALLATLTYQRAIEWQDPTSFHKQEFEISGDNPDAKVMWAIELAEQDEYKEAEILLKDVMDYYQQNNYMNVVAADNYLRVMQAQGGYYESIGPAIKMLAKVDQPRARSRLLTSLAAAYIELDGCEMATGFLETAIRLDRSNERAIEFGKQCNVIN